MHLESGTNALREVIAMKKPERSCKVCHTAYSGVGRTCPRCLKAQAREKRKENLERIKLKKQERKQKKKEQRANRPSKLKKTLDALISLYVRKRAADASGKASCVSCGRKEAYTALQGGHYVSRSHYSVRYDVRDIHPQCVACNIFKKGNYPAYTNYLLNTYGQEWLKQLIADGEQIKQWTVPELQLEIAKYQILLKNL